MKPREIFITTSLIALIIVAVISIFWMPILWSLLLFIPLILIGIADIFQKKHAIKNNFPVIGHFRYLLESFRPEIQQYFVETDTEGTPINRVFRSLIYSRAKNENDTTPFGTKSDVYRTGYECMAHSMYPKHHDEVEQNPRVLFGGKDCKQPYHASILNISAMSFGSLSKNAILALSKGAKLGGFAHNTGEGGLSPYHLEGGGDLIWQIGTGYFGCRTKNGDFCPDTFEKKARIENVKMIEIKLSQGAKPGHGGILPASKNTEEIAKIRDVVPHTDVLSPPYHTAFKNADGLLHFVQQLRELSGGKPVGFKLCVGSKEEFIEVCEAMKKTQILPDFITVDGGEGGTGAAPVEFTNSIGLPLREGLAFVVDSLIKYKFKNHIRVIASGRVFSAFHIIRLIALGADTVNSARAMMMAIGCIQALQCNTNTCPVGVATQDKSLMKGLDVNDKYVRVANFHKKTVNSYSEMIAAAGLSNGDEIQRKHILHRLGPNQMVTYEELYPEHSLKL
ncbi:MAG: FMN-binding glutamate synthase family protein [Flavobacteriales bacterium]|nr:FMN-binding glutamate synthase family protein [Flavobacteriia bacterium]NCP04910.1 FMN-binding glutamate synthase family protein [Flavobacteriales bacterium]PIV95212.1 MAG: FMN-binding glutamate synthase family protein [Flavobacteriaceae bacterium CG17_big_fil_post_rev_8_21_14_2_50_33_15]PIY11708.1 MAG: FMN-binding glutamate synthase family protein [Flavobacteriaceae bacterium CG_4_10_14_3_um_filter_33_47]PJB16957.1 MAG: FMN-binding glutamate synthase family protein [Flavobacteriaceae bacter